MMSVPRWAYLIGAGLPNPKRADLSSNQEPFSSSLLLRNLELSETKVYEP